MTGVQTCALPIFHDIVAIAAGEYTSYALAADGTVYAWGWNEHGELGNGTWNYTYEHYRWYTNAYYGDYAICYSISDEGAYFPIQVSGLSNVVSIAAGRDYAVALDATGRVFYWGNNGGYFTSFEEQYPGIHATTCHEDPVRRGTSFDAVQGTYADRLNFLNSDQVAARFWYVHASRYHSACYNYINFSYEVSREFPDNYYLRSGDGVYRRNEWNRSGDNHYRTEMLHVDMFVKTPTQVLGPGGTDHLGDSTGNYATALGSNDVIAAATGQATANRTARATKLVAGEMFTAALMSDGTVYAWGLNSNGQLGDETTMDRIYPTQVRSGDQKNGTQYLQGIVDIAAGKEHMVALDTNGDVYAWGNNVNGQVLRGSNEANFNAPTLVKLGEDIIITNVEAGDNATMAIDSFGHVFGWGDNSQNQLSEGAALDNADLDASIVMIQGESMNYTTNEGGIQLYDGAAVIDNANGQAPFTRATTAAVNGSMSTIIRADGSVWSVGTPTAKEIGSYDEHNAKGTTLGNGKLTAVNAPVRVGEEDTNTLYLGDMTAITPDKETHTPVETTMSFDSTSRLSGEVVKLSSSMVWINDGKLQQIDGTTLIIDIDEVQRFLVPGFNANVKAYGAQSEDSHDAGYNAILDATLDEFEILSSNSNIVTVEKIDGTLRIKASEIDGASFGTATVLIRHIPTNTTRILRVEIVPVIYEASPRVAAPKVAYGTSDNNAGFAVTLKANGTVWVWGDDAHGQLGDGFTGTNAYEYGPVQVRGVGGNGYLKNIVDIAAGHGFVVALDKDGKVYAWGLNTRSQMGNGTVDGAATHDHSGDQLFPVLVSIPEDVKITAISAGTNHALALDTQGMIWAWGDNSYSQVGARTREAYYTTPIRVERSGLVNNNDLNTQYLTGVVAVAAGRNFSVALLADGTVMTWGAAYMNNAWNYDLGDVNRTRTNQERNSSGYAYLTSGVAGDRKSVV